MVAGLLTALTFAVIQFGIAVYVRNVIHDAAVEGAYYGALADTSAQAGAQRTRDLVSRAIGPGFAGDVTAQASVIGGEAVIEVRVKAGMPILGLLPSALTTEVSAHAPQESFDR